MLILVWHPTKETQMDYSNQYYQVVRYSVNRKRQVIDHVMADVYTMQMQMIEDAVLAQQHVGFPEATQVLDHIRAL